jgi:hypothetical protein
VRCLREAASTEGKGIALIKQQAEPSQLNPHRETIMLDQHSLMVGRGVSGRSQIKHLSPRAQAESDNYCSNDGYGRDSRQFDS